MYENIGNKIKILAMVLALIGTGASICYGVVLLSDEEVAFGMLARRAFSRSS